MQICFVDMSTLNVEDKDDKVGILCSPHLEWVGNILEAIWFVGKAERKHGK